MSNSGKGFGSLSREKRKKIAQLGGQASAEVFKRTGKGHAWTPEEAKAAGTKAAMKLKRRKAIDAALLLIKAGFTPVRLAAAKMTDDEYIKLGKLAKAENLYGIEAYLVKKESDGKDI